MYSLSTKPQTKLWVVTLGIVISIIIVTPQDFPLKASLAGVWTKLVEIKNSHIDQETLGSDIVEFFEGRQAD